MATGLLIAALDSGGVDAQPAGVLADFCDDVGLERVEGDGGAVFGCFEAALHGGLGHVDGARTARFEGFDCEEADLWSSSEH